ncbi:MAG: ATP-binding protein [Myxococcota bacterium]
MDERDWQGLWKRIDRVLRLVEDRLTPIDHDDAEARAPETWAFRWRAESLQPIEYPDLYPLESLIGIDRSIALLRRNLAAFTAGQPALDALLYGERGTGKSSAVRGLLAEFGRSGLRLVEVRPDELRDLPRIWGVLRKRPERYAIFCDDLAFERVDAAYRELKAALEGGVEARPPNVLLLATSNRRYLVPERMWENLEATHGPGGELHPGEKTEEKLSLSDRFGLLVPFLGFDQETYLKIVEHHARQLGLWERLPQRELEQRALRFALERSSRSGRTARQACIWVLQQLDGVGR